MSMAEDKDLEALKAKLEEAQKSIDALSAKNKELLEEKRSTKSGAERQLLEAQDRITELESNLAKVQADAKKAIDKASGDAKAAQELAAAKSQSLARLIKDEGLQRELLAAGVKNPAHLKAAQAMLRELVEVDDEKAEAFVKTKDAKGVETRKSLADFAKEWAGTDEGKAFVAVPASSGSGASGGGSHIPAGKVMPRSEFTALAPEAQAKFAVEGGKLTD